MTVEHESPTSSKPSKVPSITGWVLSTLIVLMFAVLPIVFWIAKPENLQGIRGYGYPEGSWKWITTVSIVSVILYAIPHTSMLGAILLTAYLGGAVATHAQGLTPQPGAAPVGEQFVPAVVAASVIWLALLLREPRLRTLLPIRR